MRVLYIQDSLGTGGAEKSNAELWYYLREKGVKIKIVVLEHREEGIEQEILNAAFEVIFLDQGSFFHHMVQLKRIIKDYQPDLVHSILFKAAMRTRSAKLLINFKNIESLVNATYAKIRYKDPKINSKTLRIYEKLDGFSEKFGVDHFIAITQEVARHYQEHLNIKKEKISVIYRGRKENPNLNRKKELRATFTEELGLNSGGPIFIHVGRQEFQKAHLDILKAIKIADNQLFSAGAQFLFCGRKGNASAAIEEFLKDNEMKTRIKFLGHRNDIYELLAAADVFVFPSLFEGLGGSLIEAQAAGLPVICSDITVFKEVITERNALIHETNNPESLAKQLVQILSEDWKKMGEISLKNYAHNFKLEEVNKNMFDLYKNLLE
ncbi:glycosyltransferase family 4 protein [Salegentibacter flavus]|uniref:Glycosyltransferase involved in cell wall bisynthesis n=1 Tax=Salegentibacter flavus TaxID=287099 RepID=A0A1I5BGH2_9FLAO|nr:glycosyltransferase family 4 protein [Salegentibacter flavus]SFN73767.1 Glycosyltransferase involved in cell wall bisynthesis [Salegentibacter flavus]